MGHEAVTPTGQVGGAGSPAGRRRSQRGGSADFRCPHPSHMPLDMVLHALNGRFIEWLTGIYLHGV